MLLSLACIAKDEEDMIAGLLSSVRGLVDEAVVVDTGSADNTVAVAEGLGAKVIRSTWRGSFADARNESLDQCRGEWIIFLDADERVTPTGFKAVRRLLAAAKEDGFYVTLVNYADLAMATPVEDIKVFRVFRRRPEYHFSGSIHEQVLPEVLARGKGIGLLPPALQCPPIRCKLGLECWREAGGPLPEYYDITISSSTGEHAGPRQRWSFTDVSFTNSETS